MTTHAAKAPEAANERATRTWAVTDVRCPLGDRIVAGRTVVVEEGTIVDLHDGAAPPDAVDGRGLLLLPGFVDCHSDGLEKEVSPRRTANFPLDYALVSFEAKLRAAGVTTVFHGLPYQDRPDAGRSVAGARETLAVLSARREDPQAGVEHRVLYRFEARDPVALEPLLSDLDVNRIGNQAPLISFEDHTPGQGQYRDPAQFVAAIDPASLPPGVTPEAHVAQIMAEADEVAHVRVTNLDRLAPLAREGRIELLGHDLEHGDDVDRAWEAGATIAEFPVTLEAARAARRRDMTIVMGAPNALRGGSHTGNASARELVAAGLCDVLASDYLPSALLAACFEMANQKHCSLPRALRLITSGPARMAGLQDRGALDVGMRADLVLVDDRGRWPNVVGLWRADDGPERSVGLRLR